MLRVPIDTLRTEVPKVYSDFTQQPLALMLRPQCLVDNGTNQKELIQRPMVAIPISNFAATPQGNSTTALLNGEVLIETHPHTATGAAVTAQMYVPVVRSQLWEYLTDYSRWVHYFPHITDSRVLGQVKEQVRDKANAHRVTRRLYQAARKAFVIFTAQVEIYLHVIETLQQSIQFRLERGTFSDFTADLTLEDFQQGTLLTYSVRATPTIPVPGFLLETAMRNELPGNLRTKRRVLCQ